MIRRRPADLFAQRPADAQRLSRLLAAWEREMK